MVTIEEFLKKDCKKFEEFSTTGILRKGLCTILNNNEVLSKHDYMFRFWEFVEELEIYTNKNILNFLILGEGVGQLSRLIDNQMTDKNFIVSITGVEKLKMLENFRVKHNYKSDFKVVYQDAVDFIKETNEVFYICFIDVFETSPTAIESVINEVDKTIIQKCKHVFVNLIDPEQKQKVFDTVNCNCLGRGFDIWCNTIFYFTKEKISESFPNEENEFKLKQNF